MSTRQLSIVVCPDPHDGSKSGSILPSIIPVSVHAAAFRVPSHHQTSIQAINTPALRSSHMANQFQNQPSKCSVKTQQARVPTVLPQAHSSAGLRHPWSCPFVNHATIHSKLAAPPVCTCHVPCEGSRWSHETHLAARARWTDAGQESKWEGSKMDGWTDSCRGNPAVGPTMRSQSPQSPTASEPTTKPKDQSKANTDTEWHPRHCSWPKPDPNTCR